MIPQAVTVATVEEELAGLQCYSTRHGWAVHWVPESLFLHFSGKGTQAVVPLRIVAQVDGYRALPPIWRFERGGSAEGTACFPIAGRSPTDGGSIFHSSRIICAHFNRLAYKDHGGPHGDWGGPPNWEAAVRPQYVSGLTLAGMLGVILAHLKYSPGVH